VTDTLTPEGEAFVTDICKALTFQGPTLLAKNVGHVFQGGTRPSTAADVAAVMTATERAKAAREANRHPQTGVFQSPSRGAEQIQKAGPFSYVKAVPGRGVMGITAH
jgi:hypothetical protein